MDSEYFPVYVCPVHSVLSREDMTLIRKFLSDTVREVRCLATLGCRYWGSSMLSFMSDEVKDEAAKFAIDELSSSSDIDDLTYILNTLKSSFGIRGVLVSIDLIRSCLPRSKLDAPVRNYVSELIEIDVGDICDINIVEGLNKQMSDREESIRKKARKVTDMMSQM